MERVAIIGCGGSGKSTLARRIGATLDVPVHHLDRWYWKAGWIATPTDEWTAIHERLCSEPTWRLESEKDVVILDSRAAARAFLSSLGKMPAQTLRLRRFS